MNADVECITPAEVVASVLGPLLAVAREVAGEHDEANRFHMDPDAKRAAITAARAGLTALIGDVEQVGVRELAEAVRAGAAHVLDAALLDLRVLGARQVDALARSVRDAERALPRQRADGRAQKPEAVEHALAPLLGNLRLPDDLVAPFGFEVDVDGVWKLREESRTQVAAAPLVLTGRLVDALGETWWVTEFQDHSVGRWGTALAPRSAYLNAREIIAVGNLPVASDNAGAVVEFLRKFDASATKIPRARLVRALGWDADGWFHAGSVAIQPTGEAAEVRGARDERPAEWGAARVFVHPPAGHARHLGSLRRSGLREAWFSAVQGLKDEARIGAVAALAAPLMGICIGASVPNFVLEWAGMTSTGKSTSLRVAASVWGDPTDGQFLRGWNSTVAGIEDYAGFMRHLPICLDETSAIEPRYRDKVVVQTVFQFVNGKGRDRRLPRGGMQDAVDMRGILLSTGEQSMTTFGDQTTSGQQLRVLTITGAPARSDAEAKATLSSLQAHHGHVGAEWVTWLVQRRSEWGTWAAEVAALSIDIAARLPGPTKRLSPQLALLEFTSRLAYRAIGLPPVDLAKVFDGSRFADVAESADLGRAALRAVLEWMDAHPGRVWGRHSIAASRAGDLSGDRAIRHPQGWACVDLEGVVGVLPAVVAEILEPAGFNARGAVEAWKTRGWLVTEQDGSRIRVPKTKFKVDEDRPRVYQFTPEALDGLA